MENMVWWRNRLCLSLVLSGLAMAASVQAQQAMLPNADGSNSTFNASGDVQTKAGTGASSAALAAIPDDFPDLRLTSGVLLDMMVYDEPELATQARVDDKGNISLPLIGAVHVAGKTVAEARTVVQEKYRDAQILKDPQVTLNVLQYVNSNVSVLGEVQSPGRFPMLAPHSLQDVIGMAGGETNFAGDTIKVEGPAKDGNALRTYHYVRGEDENALQNAIINPGDTVRVERAGIVYVLGAVYRPGGYVMQENGSLNVAQAVSLAQGTLLQAKIGGMRVIRREPDGTLKDIPISYKGIMKGKDTPLELEAQDIVYVPVSKVKSVFTAGANIVGETSSAAIYTVK
jgi:polysaccharide export outer membrane protein